MGRHEIDGIRGRHLRGNNEISLILAILIIDQDEHLAVSGILNDVLDRRENLLILHRSFNVLLRDGLQVFCILSHDYFRSSNRAT